MPAEPGPITAAPCDGTGAIDRATGLCRGCFRTLDEIADWGGASDGEKRAILRAIEQRRR